MGRIRTIKPSFYKHEDLYEAEKAAGLPLRIAFSGIWTVCDRDGRFHWKPRTLKTDVLPYDDVDFTAVLDALAASGFIVKYTVDGRSYGYVPSWTEHQIINNREEQSKIPAPVDACPTRAPRVPEVVGTRHGNYQGEGKGKEGKEEDASITPEMISCGVLSELSLSGRDLAVALDEVCRAEVKKGRDATELRDEMIEAWRQYDRAKPLLTYTKGAAKFFGDGDWRNKVGWPWKPGSQSIEVKPMTTAEKMRRQA